LDFSVHIDKVLIALLGELGSQTNCLALALDFVDVLPESKDLKKLSEIWILLDCYHDYKVNEF